MHSQKKDQKKKKRNYIWARRMLTSSIEEAQKKHDKNHLTNQN